YAVNLNSDIVRTFLPRPAIYNTGQYGLMGLYQIYCTENLDRSGIIFAFGLSPEIHEVKFEDLTQPVPHCLQSDHIKNIKPYGSDNKKWHFDQAQMMVYDQNVSYYANIYALPGTQHYVRFNSVGPNFVGGTFRKEWVSIFSEDFNKLGEVSIKEK